MVIEHGDSTLYLFEDKQDYYVGRNETLSVNGSNVSFVPAYNAPAISCVTSSKTHSKLDPSWDRDGDGVNDCELDGSCDHTSDYTLPRQNEGRMK